MLKEFLMKKMMEHQLKNANIPADQKEKLMNMIMKNPDLFQKIAEESQALMQEKGLDQMTAAMQVMMKYKSELQKLA